eukprot:4696434-Alexandrium_andersonii.AAC.1
MAAARATRGACVRAGAGPAFLATAPHCRLLRPSVPGAAVGDACLDQVWPPCAGACGQLEDLRNVEGRG